MTALLPVASVPYRTKFRHGAALGYNESALLIMTEPRYLTERSVASVRICVSRQGNVWLSVVRISSSGSWNTELRMAQFCSSERKICKVGC